MSEDVDKDATKEDVEVSDGEEEYESISSDESEE